MQILSRKGQSYKEVAKLNVNTKKCSKPLLAKDFEEHLSTKKQNSISNIGVESDINEKSTDTKQGQLRQPSVIDKITSHPCEICKLFD